MNITTTLFSQHMWLPILTSGYNYVLFVLGFNLPVYQVERLACPLNGDLDSASLAAWVALLVRASALSVIPT